MIIAYYYTYILREQNLLPMKFEYMLQILFTLKFLGVRYIVITLYLNRYQDKEWFLIFKATSTKNDHWSTYLWIPSSQG